MASYHSLMHAFRVPSNTIYIFIPEVCEAIAAEFDEEVIDNPTTPDQSKTKASLFSVRWQFYHCVGVLDGKNIAMKCPPRGNSI